MFFEQKDNLSNYLTIDFMTTTPSVYAAPATYDAIGFTSTSSYRQDVPAVESLSPIEACYAPQLYDLDWGEGDGESSGTTIGEIGENDNAIGAATPIGDIFLPLILMLFFYTAWKIVRFLLGGFRKNVLP